MIIVISYHLIVCSICFFIQKVYLKKKKEKEKGVPIIAQQK